MSFHRSPPPDLPPGFAWLITLKAPAYDAAIQHAVYVDTGQSLCGRFGFITHDGRVASELFSTEYCECCVLGAARYITALNSEPKGETE